MKLRHHECGGVSRSVSQYGICLHCGDGPTSTPEKVEIDGKARLVPSVQTMARWISDGVAKATDGCKVEPDGTCPNGQPSWLVKLNLI